jgi:hypothetical protein
MSVKHAPKNPKEWRDGPLCERVPACVAAIESAVSLVTCKTCLKRLSQQASATEEKKP